jgi:tripartite-type tricarboxylate transporter receptor subunit TctC
MKLLRRVAATIAVLLCALQPAAAQEDFYKGKQITLIIGLGAGETYDLYARLLARHLP